MKGWWVVSRGQVMEEYEGEAGGCLKLQVGGRAETYKLVLGTFPKDFSQVATSPGYFPKWQLSNVQFPERLLPKG